MTTPNLVLARLGFPKVARLVIFHVDDVGAGQHARLGERLDRL